MAPVRTAAAPTRPRVFVQGGTAAQRAEIERELCPLVAADNRRDAGLVLLLDGVRDERAPQIRSIRACREENPHALIVVVSSNGTDRFVHAFREGAADCVQWPGERSRLHTWCDRVVQQLPPAGAFVGSSLAMTAVRASLRQLAAVNCRVLLCGETGTGKEVAARSLHEWSPRANGPFVTINCPAIPESLFESELFGFERGAFSGAVQTHAGRLMDGDRGTVFLDEVSELPLAMQAKLLRVMEQGEVQRLGARGTQRVDVRWVAATNRNLRAMAQAGSFRADLYYRLAVAETFLPPLRERKDDLPELVAHFGAVAGRDMSVIAAGFTESAMDALHAHDWPGNLRELRNAVEIAVLRASGLPVNASHLPSAVTGGLPDTRDDLERVRILDALERVQWNKSEAAKQLQWSRMTLYRKLAYYHLETSARGHPR
jgi:DNA-binding NtrC family response regulator